MSRRPRFFSEEPATEDEMLRDDIDIILSWENTSLKSEPRREEGTGTSETPNQTPDQTPS